ncbi:MAG: hypothetical protein ABI597_01750 [Gammaproteobacteria bacterium]
MTKNIKQIFYCLLLILYLTSFSTFGANIHRITDYHQTFFPCYNKEGDLRIAIRMYYFDSTPYLLVVNPSTFITETAPATEFKPRKIIGDVPGYFTMRELRETPYIKALVKYTLPPYVLQNYGITHAEKPVDGLFLTVDLCPSIKTFETNLFNTLVTMAENQHHSMSVALSVSGLWIIGHPEEFNWLIQQVKDNKLKIIWINHSFSHVYYADLPLEQNFLLEPHTNTTHEILATEKLLLEHGQLPSVFFRFPGLVSNEKLILKLNKYGLIPVGADAWLAKGEEPKTGSFILVHGNSNEPQGIKILMPILKDLNNHWLPLDEAFVKGN